MAELIDYALASVRTYFRRQENRGPVPPGWSEQTTWYRRDGLSGFSASLFQNGNELIIAYTGTNEAVKDFAIANIPAATGIISPQVIAAIQYYADIRAAFPDAQITFTGHSLGAGLASLMSVFFNHAGMEH